MLFSGQLMCPSRCKMDSSSLVKYDTKILVSTSGKGAKGSKKIKNQPISLDKAALSPTEDILNSILPPRESTEDGQLWVQYVSSDPATPADVVKLQEELDRRLVQRQARETGICPIREELYAQAFDELIRQVTIICTERGLLLLRVRDEIRMTIQAYQTLYESSIAFGMRKALQAEQRKAKTESDIKTLDEDCTHLQADVVALEQEIKDLEVREKERVEKEDKEHSETMELKNRYNQTLREKLETLLSAPKK